MGLRFTILTNFQGQRVYVPNRNIVLVSRFRSGVLRAYVDIQVPTGIEERALLAIVDGKARGFQSQHRAAITNHGVFGFLEAEGGGWRFLRLRFRV